MRISTFFSSLAGMYVAQSFCHSLIASIIMDQALRAWKISNPAIRQRFRLVVVLYPVFSFPLYQLINPDRSSVLFRIDALFDVNRWLNVEIWGAFSLGLLFLSLLAVTSLIFIFQELIPILRHTLESRTLEHEGIQRESNLFVEDASRKLAITAPEVYVVEDDDLVIFSTTGKNPAIFLSSGLATALTPDEMHAALAHEMAHIVRSRRPVLLAAFFLRMILFFNPIALVEFRRVVRNEEKICDDIAVMLTGRPKALAEALKKFYTSRKEPEPEVQQKPLLATVPLEEYSYNIQLDSRVTRLEQHSPPAAGNQWVLLIVAFLIVVCVNYFVV
jgi:Zn-dependent protease with chaperone function